VVKKTHGIAQGPKMGPIQVYGSMKVKEPAEVNFKHGVSQRNCRSLRSQANPLLSHFQNDGAIVECSTLVQIQLATRCFSELKRDGRKGVRKRQRRVLVKRNVRGGNLTGELGGGLTQACALEALRNALYNTYLLTYLRRLWVASIA